MIVPVNAESFSHAMKIGTEIFHTLKSILSARGLSTSVGDEGGFAPKLKGTEDALETIIKSIISAGFKPGEDVMIALDCASSEFFEKIIIMITGYLKVKMEKSLILTTNDYLSDLVGKYPIISIEDGMDENDWVVGFIQQMFLGIKFISW